MHFNRDIPEDQDGTVEKIRIWRTILPCHSHLALVNCGVCTFLKIFHFQWNIEDTFTASFLNLILKKSYKVYFYWKHYRKMSGIFLLSDIVLYPYSIKAIGKTYVWQGFCANPSKFSGNCHHKLIFCCSGKNFDDETQNLTVI